MIMKNFIEVSDNSGNHILINIAAIESVTATKDGNAVIDTVTPGWGLVQGYSGDPFNRFVVTETYDQVKAMIAAALE